MRLFSKSPRSIITCSEFAVEVELSWPWLATVGTSSKVTWKQNNMVKTGAEAWVILDEVSPALRLDDPRGPA